jgi:ADP-ribose pyrophosphatase YjhB (NUDIX family)
MAEAPWLLWAREIQALAQTGLAYTRDVFDRQRYERLREIAAEIVAASAALDADGTLAAFTAQSGYPTPKVDVRTACFQSSGEVLLVQERADGLWTLPGGWADVNDSPVEAAIREVREESGFNVRIKKLAALFDRLKHPHPPQFFHTYKLFFIGEVVGGMATPSAETSAVGYFSLDRLPPLSIDRVLPGQIARMHEHWQNPELPTDCD